MSFGYIGFGYWAARSGNYIAHNVFLVIIVLNFFVGIAVSLMPFIYPSYNVGRVSIPTMGLTCSALNVALFIIAIRSTRNF
ncbi:hypothetical protein HK096_002334, partial [Nowakowskiella sp. JEL0078]